MVLKNRFYSKKEIDFLRENIAKFGVDVCAKKIGRTYESVRGKCFSEFGHCTILCNATEDEINKLTFESDFNPLSIDFSIAKAPKELAYFLGYFWADGYVRGSGDLVIEIMKEDGDDIEEIFKKVADFKIYERKRGNKKTQKSFYYTDYNKTIANSLKELGKYTNSIESHKNILEYIPQEYVKYFLRGLIDGDGCIYTFPVKNKHSKIQLSISGKYEQDWGFICNFLKENFGIKFNVSLRTYKSYKSSLIRATNNDKIISFLNEIYGEDDGIYLKRKYKKIKRILND